MIAKLRQHLVRTLGTWRRLAGSADGRVLLGLLALYVALHAVTLRDYGLTWDVNEFYVGDANLHFWATLDASYLDYAQDHGMRLYQRPDHPDLYTITVKQFRNASWEKPWEIWPLGCTLSSLSKYVCHVWLGWLDAYDGHHAFLMGFGALLLVSTFLFCRACWGRWPAVIAVVALFTHPRWWADLHNNFKDVPSVVFFALTIQAFAWAMRQRQARWLVVSALAWGLGLATKANALLLAPILGPWFLLALWAWRRPGEPLLPRRMWLAVVGYPFLGLAVMALLWPYLWVDFPQHLLRYIESLGGRGLQGEPGWQTLPLLLFVTTTPPVMLLLALVGGGVMAGRSVAARRLDPLAVLLALWLVVPIGRVVLPKAIDFDGIRHWYEFLPALAALAGIGGGWLIDRGQAWVGRQSWRQQFATPLGLKAWPPLAKALAIVVAFGPVCVWNVVNHPNQVAYFNRLIGGLRGAQARGVPQATDYWGSSYRQAIAWLNGHAAPGSLIVAGAAPHLLVYGHGIWLRADLPLYLPDRRPPEVLLAEFERYPGPVYLVTITREDVYVPLVAEVVRTRSPIHEIAVDGATILEIFVLKVK